MKQFFPARVFVSLLLAGTGVTGCYAQNGDTNGQNGAAKAVQPTPSAAGLRQVSLTVQSRAKTHEFTIEVARTVEEQARGLMFRTELAPDKGMIFPFTEDRPASFWMKNTVIPLDIIFVRRNGTIESITANTTPYSLEPVQSGEAVAAVLELAGGRTAELSIQPGDKVNWEQ